MRTIFLLDKDWKFSVEKEKTHAKTHEISYASCKSGGCIGPASRSFDDSEWKRVDVPHDYLVETPFSPEASHSHGYKSGADFWYRKSFKMDKKYAGMHFLLCFEGISVFSEIYVNGSLVERSFSAYCEIPIDITDRIHFGDKPNIISVRVDAQSEEGWWYEGAGIYRHVRLYAKAPLHIAHNGLWINPVLKKTTENDWLVNCEAAVENSEYTENNLEIKFTVFDKNNTIINSAYSRAVCSADGTCTVSAQTEISNPERWDIENPVLYRAVCELYSDGRLLDSDETFFGFRTFYADADKGFFLNGRKVLIKGTCNHQDHAGVGVAVPDSVQYYRIKRLKDMGSNAYRCSHNMPSKEILDACDRLGMIVMDENRRFECSKDVLNQLRTLVKRDRNHPSVIFYSLFNEEPLQNTDEGKRIFLRMKNEVLKLDNTRLIAGAINGITSGKNGTALEMDVTGFNYDIYSIARFHEMYPDQPVIGSENNSTTATRGCIETDMNAHVLCGYDENCVPWGHTVRQTWKVVQNSDYLCGIFVWTGFDYRGEPTPFKYPSVSSQFGIMDTCGFAKDCFYFNKACFDEKPMIHVMPHWNHKTGSKVRVMTASNCEEAELFLNGKSLGRKKSDVCTQCEWQVNFEPGQLKAVGYNSGIEAAVHTVETTGEPKKIVLLPQLDMIKNDGQDTVPVNVCVTDSNGRIVPTASNYIEFALQGDGKIIGVGNGDPNCHESDVLPQRSLFSGWCQVLVQSKENAQTIKLIAKSKGLEDAEYEFRVNKVKQPLYIYNDDGRVLSNWTMSAETFLQKPDPLMKISDDDMNSFEPIDLEYGFQDYQSGYKIFRCNFRLANKTEKSYKIMFTAIAASEMEVYINGKCEANIINPPYFKPLEVRFTALPGVNNEMRVLIKAIDSKNSGIKYDVIITQDY